jgi:hypothetical protein
MISNGRNLFSFEEFIYFIYLFWVCLWFKFDFTTANPTGSFFYIVCADILGFLV